VVPWSPPTVIRLLDSNSTDFIRDLRGEKLTKGPVSLATTAWLKSATTMSSKPRGNHAKQRMTNGKGTILAVDDESESLKLLTDILTEQGYRVRPANSGTLALASAAVDSPELILLDIRMPGMEGFEVCRRLKESEQSRRIPLIFISGSTNEQEQVEGLSLGAVDFITKPFRREELLARVRTHLELGRLQTRLEDEVSERTTALRAAVEQLQREVAERRRAEAGLRESEERFRNMADSAPVMICTFGPDKLATFFNSAWLDFTGRSLEQELGYGWHSSVHPDDFHNFLDKYSFAYDARSNCHVEYRLRRADGQYRSVAWNGVPRFAPQGDFEGYIISCFDITDVKRAQEEAMARQKLESMGLMAGGIAHDFGNLLGTIIASAELAATERDEGLSPEDELQRIKTTAVRGSELVHELMIYAGHENPAFESVELPALVNEMLHLLKVAVSKRLVLKIDHAEDLPAVRASSTQLRQVVMNLISNGSDAIGDQPGEIRLSTRLVKVAGKTSKAAGNLPRGDYLCLQVSDTGSGMTREVQARIFDPFFSTKDAGRGLGLAVVQGIVRSHGGTIKVASEPGKGTTFEILLPSASAPAKRDAAASRFSEPLPEAFRAASSG
jgi:PAS domain S-box-containing protein